MVESASASADKRDPRHAHFSPDVEIVSTSSGEGVGLSTDDIACALENLSLRPSPRHRTLTSGISAPDSVPNLSEEVKSDSVQKPALEEVSGVSDVARSHHSALRMRESELTSPKRYAVLFKYESSASLAALVLLEILTLCLGCVSITCNMSFASLNHYENIHLCSSRYMVWSYYIDISEAFYCLCSNCCLLLLL